MARKKKRPAEKTTVAGYVALLAGYFLGIDDPKVVLALAGVLAAIPAAVTWYMVNVKDRDESGYGLIEAVVRVLLVLILVVVLLKLL